MMFVRIAAVCLLPLAAAQAVSRNGIEYSRYGHSPLRMDAHIPDGPGPFPAAIIVHGGAWVAGSRHIDAKPLFKPLTNAGYASFSISYSMARKPPLHGAIIDVSKIDVAVEDVQQAVRFVRSHAAEYRVDPGRIVLIGESAGAHLASIAALRGAQVQAVVAFYCPSDLTAMAGDGGFLREAAARLAWGRLSPEDLRSLSPIAAVHSGMPPFLFIHGTADHVVPFDQSTNMCRQIKAVGGVCDVIPVKGGLHGVLLWEAFHQTAYKLRMIDWLDRILH